MEILMKYKKWIIGAVVLIILFIVYSVFFNNSSSNNSGSDALLSSNTSQRPAEIVGNEIITALNQIEALILDRSLFADPVYRSLKDRSQIIPPEPVGKANPFDPIGGRLTTRRQGEFDNFSTSSVPNLTPDTPETGPRGNSTFINRSLIDQPAI